MRVNLLVSSTGFGCIFVRSELETREFRLSSNVIDRYSNFERRRVSLLSCFGGAQGVHTLRHNRYLAFGNI